MISVFLTVLPLFLIMGAGALFRKLKIVHADWISILNRYALYAAFPAVVIQQLATPGNGTEIGIKIILMNFILLGGVMIAVYLISRKAGASSGTSAAFSVCGAYGNVAYLGLPFITSIIPDSGPHVILHVAIYLVLIFTLGLFLLERSKTDGGHPLKALLMAFRNPLFVSVLIGLLLRFLAIQIPAPLIKALTMLGNSASPAVLFALGAFLAQGVRLNKSLRMGAILAGLKLIMLPALFLITARIFSPGEAFKISILESAMPVGLTAFSLAQEYPVDKEAVASAVFISTILSIVALPFITSLL